MTLVVDRRRPEPPLAVYGTALRHAAAGGHAVITAIDPAGRVRAFAPASWCGELIDGDEGLLHRCAGPTLDVGCGPGRLTGALAARGCPALGIDISAAAVRIARGRGIRALCRDVFAPLPEEGHWQRLLLADGNIGIGGNPTRLLLRCRELVAPEGRILVETDPPGAPTWAGHLRISAPGCAPSAPFPWAYVGVNAAEALARTAGLRIGGVWTEAGRWFADLGRR